MKKTKSTFHGSRQSNERGYNLVEVIIAIALMGTVLISIVSLFLIGQARVYSGKQMTQAIAIGTQVLEDLSSMSQQDMNTAFGITATTTMGTVDVDTTRILPTDSYPNAILRTTKGTIVAAQDVRGLLAKWKGIAETDRVLRNGYVTLMIAPRNQNPPAATLNPANATTMKVRVLVRWNEGRRAREVILDTVKTNRP